MDFCDLFSSNFLEKPKIGFENMKSKELWIVARILNTKPESSDQEFNKLLQLFSGTSQNGKQEYCEFLQVLISQVPRLQVLDKCAMHYFDVISPKDPQDESFGKIIMKYIGLMTSCSSQLAIKFRDRFDVSWFHHFELNYKHFWMKEMIGEDNEKVNQHVLELFNKNFSGIHFLLQRYMFDIVQLNYPDIWNSRRKEVVQELQLLYQYDIISQMSYLPLGILLLTTPQQREKYVINFGIPFLLRTLFNLKADEKVEDVCKIRYNSEIRFF